MNTTPGDDSLKSRCRTTLIILSRKDIENQFGNKFKEAAKNLNVSQSTLRRKCRDLGISPWPRPPKSSTRNANASIASSCASSCAPLGMLDNAPDRMGPTFVNEEVNGTFQQLTIKASYNHKMIKLLVPISEATFLYMEKKIGMEFNLMPGTYTLKYLDEDEDLIFLGNEYAMNVCIRFMRNYGRDKLRVFVTSSSQPVS